MLLDLREKLFFMYMLLDWQGNCMIGSEKKILQHFAQNAMRDPEGSSEVLKVIYFV